MDFTGYRQIWETYMANPVLETASCATHRSAFFRAAKPNALFSAKKR
jgi:hypothetical protein